ncbi:MAG: biotin transporter BioY [Phototrophicales bacterium]|nr:MAG: biotin transporter BioY [Phototrophicales bacterium]
MLYTTQSTIAQNTVIRVAAIVSFTLLTALGARLSIPNQPVPFTFQVMVVLLAGLVLGPRDGFASQVLYLLAIAGGAPLDANGLGAAALSGPTAGYLYSFPIAAMAAGFLAIRQSVLVRWIAAMVGVGVIYVLGATYLKQYLGISWARAYELGVEPFILFDVLKALMAATLAESGRYWLMRFGNNAQ